MLNKVVDQNTLTTFNKVHKEFATTQTLRFEGSTVYSERDFKLAQTYVKNIEFCNALAGCTSVIKHFEMKEAKHYQDLILDRNTEAGVEIDEIIAARRLAEIFKSRKVFNNLEDFLSTCLKQSDAINATLLKDKAGKLINCSKDLLTDNSDGASSADAILTDSSIVFTINNSLKEFQVSCILKCELTNSISQCINIKAQEEQTRQKVHENELNSMIMSQSLSKSISRPKHNLVSFEKMKDTKIKIGFFMATNSSQAGKEKQDNQFKKKINAFVMMMDSVESILKSLNFLFRTGSVYDLRKLIANRLQKKEDLAVSTQSPEFDPVTISKTGGLIKVEETNLAIQTCPLANNEDMETDYFFRK